VDLDGSLTPISDGASVIMGNGGRIALSIAAVLAFLTTANAGIMTAARSLVPLSRDRLFPEAFAKIGKRFGTPHNALLLTGAFIVASLFLRLEVLVEAGSIVLIMTNVLSCLSVIILRESKVQNYRPTFVAPLYPWLQIAGLVGFGFVLLEMGAEAYIISILLALAGFGAYWFYGRLRVERESALLHLIERITARELVTGTLESELKEVIRERDQIVQDRFDEIIEECPVIDVEGPMERDEFFAQAARELAEGVGMAPEALREALQKREEEGSTALDPTLAVPHVVIEGEGKFELLLARVRRGIRFSDAAPEVKAVFVLLGTRDERNFHLVALSAIAQIVGSPKFVARWTAARGPQGLRDVALLAERART